jgi:hypothetical protein
MRQLNVLWLLVFLSRTLFGQTPKSTTVTEPNDNQLRATAAAMISVENYCHDSVGALVRSHEPRLFAETHPAANQPAQWVEFSNKAAWENAGKPKPIAWVWYKDTNIIQVAMAFENSDENGPLYADYCYDPNGKLARLESIPHIQTTCDDAYFRCQLTSGREWLYVQNGQRVEVRNEMDLRLLKSERTSFTLSKFVPPEYLNVAELPFARIR